MRVPRQLELLCLCQKFVRYESDVDDGLEDQPADRLALQELDAGFVGQVSDT